LSLFFHNLKQFCLGVMHFRTLHCMDGNPFFIIIVNQLICRLLIIATSGKEKQGGYREHLSDTFLHRLLLYVKMPAYGLPERGMADLFLHVENGHPTFQLVPWLLVRLDGLMACRKEYNYKP